MDHGARTAPRARARARGRDFLSERVENNPLAANQEIEKLALSAPGARFGLAALQGAIADNSRYDVFDLVAAALAGRPDQSPQGPARPAGSRGARHDCLGHMRAEDVGWHANRMVLGKHSGRNAFKTRLRELGAELAREEDLNEAFLRFKDLADKKHEIYDEDL